MAPPVAPDPAVTPPVAQSHTEAPKYICLSLSKSKTRGVALQIFALIGTLLLAFTPVVGWAILYAIKRLVLTPHAKDVVNLQSALADSVLRSMKDYFAQFTDPENKIKVPDNLSHQYKKIADLIHMKTSISTVSPWSVSTSYNGLRLLRTELSNLLKNPDFIALKERIPKDAFVIQVLALCHIMRSGGSSKEPFVAFGRTLLPPSTPATSAAGYTLRQVSQTLTSVIRDYQGLNHESLADSVAHRILSPTKTLSSLSSQTSPTEYNPWGAGNIDTGAWTYQVQPKDGESVDYAFHFGPSPHEGDKLFQADLDLYNTAYKPPKEGYQGPPLLQHNLQTQHGHEGVRSKSQHKISEENPHLAFMTTPMDGAIWKLTDPSIPLAECGSISGFCAIYHHYAKGTIGETETPTPHLSIGTPLEDAYRRHPSKDESPRERFASANGFYIPTQLTSVDIERAFSVVGDNINTRLPEKNDEKKIVLRGTQLIVQATLFLKMLTKSAAATPPENQRETLLTGLNDELKELMRKGSVGQACKQDIDRGLSMNILTRLMVMKMAGQPITREILEEVVGEVLGRAEIVDRRMILLDRITPALCALELLGEDRNAGFFPALQEYLGAKISVKDS